MSGVDGQGRPSDTVGVTARPVGDGDGQDGLREVVARALHADWHPIEDWDTLPDSVRGYYRRLADVTLAVPEVAALRAKAAAADRVRSLIAEHQAAHVNTVWLDRLRRALDGDAPC